MPECEGEFLSEVTSLGVKFIEEVRKRLEYPQTFRRWAADALTYAILPVKHSIAVFLTVIFLLFLRRWLNANIFETLCSALKVNSKYNRSIKEAFWKLFFYCFSSSYGLYIVHTYGIQRNKLIGTGPIYLESVPGSIMLLYLVEIGFYMYSLYSILFLDIWRKDGKIFVVHHVITTLVLLYSFNLKMVFGGIWITSTFEINDILLEFSKAINYLTKSGASNLKSAKLASFLVFALSWLYIRIYLFYRECIKRLILIGGQLYTPATPLCLTIFTILIIIFIMNIYWLVLIIRILYLGITGNKLDDIREKDE